MALAAHGGAAHAGEAAAETFQTHHHSAQAVFGASFLRIRLIPHPKCSQSVAATWLSDYNPFCAAPRVPETLSKAMPLHCIQTQSAESQQLLQWKQQLRRCVSTGVLERHIVCYAGPKRNLIDETSATA